MCVVDDLEGGPASILAVQAEFLSCPSVNTLSHCGPLSSSLIASWMAPVLRGQIDFENTAPAVAAADLNDEIDRPFGVGDYFAM